MSFTREEAKKDIAKTLSAQYRVTESTFNYVYNNIDKLSDSYEAQLKAKDTAIELLESMCNLGLETQNKYSRIVKAKDEEIERLRVENRSCEGGIDALFPLPKTCSNCERNKADLYIPKEQ